MKKTVNETVQRRAPGRINHVPIGMGVWVTLLVVALLCSPIHALAGKHRRMEGGRMMETVTEKYVLDYGGTFYKTRHGEDATLHLKRMLREQYPGIDVSSYLLQKVVLVAKSKFGRGKVQLRVGPNFSHVHIVGGRPQDFHGNNRNFYDRVVIRSPFHDSWGPWQLQLSGMIKVRKVVLVVEKRRSQRHGWRQNSRQGRIYHDGARWGDRYHHDRRW